MNCTIHGILSSNAGPRLPCVFLRSRPGTGLFGSSASATHWVQSVRHLVWVKGMRKSTEKIEGMNSNVEFYFQFQYFLNIFFDKNTQERSKPPWLALKFSLQPKWGHIVLQLGEPVPVMSAPGVPALTQPRHGVGHQETHQTPLLRCLFTETINVHELFHTLMHIRIHK